MKDYEKDDFGFEEEIKKRMSRKEIFVSPSETDPTSLRARIEFLEFKLNVISKKVDMITRTVHAVAEKYDNQAMKLLSEALKRMKS